MKRDGFNCASLRMTAMAMRVRTPLTAAAGRIVTTAALRPACRCNAARPAALQSAFLRPQCGLQSLCSSFTGASPSASLTARVTRISACLRSGAMRQFVSGPCDQEHRHCRMQLHALASAALGLRMDGAASDELHPQNIRETPASALEMVHATFLGRPALA